MKKPSEIKAVLDDMARLSYKHGIFLSAQQTTSGPAIELLSTEVEGFDLYAQIQGFGIHPLAQEQKNHPALGLKSLALSDMSAHEKIEIIAGR